MKLSRRKSLHLAAAAAALPAMSRIAFALDYPTRPVRFVVGFPAGSATDIVARLIAQSLSERLGQQFIVDESARSRGAILPPRSSSGRSPMATRSFRSLHRTRSMQVSTTTSVSISSATLRRSRASCGIPT